MKIPSGLVTFLFTDIDANTKLAQEFPDAYQSALEIQDTILNKVIESYNGYIFKKAGDAFCTSFNNANDAINAAIEIQKEVIKKFKDNLIKLRIGIHTGEAEYVNNDYSGYLALSKVHRLMSAANGGQVLISQPVYDAVKGEVKSNITFKDFGKRKLKDIISPEHIYQITEESLPSDFPPINSLDARMNNLPLELTSFVGRENEVSEIKNLLSRVRLLTLIGFGGTGKTRLSIHVASQLIDEFNNGVWFVELAHLSEPSNILREIASVLNVKADEKRKTIEVVIDFLREKELLLILDNCEHLISECAVIVEEFLMNCPKLKIIVTSREYLNISGESVYKILPLSLPDTKKDISVETLLSNESVRLFIDRVLKAKQDFKITDANTRAVAQLCNQLDGIPLAIELAAARVKAMSIEKILERFKDRFNLLKGGNRTLLPRQQTLKALIDWSYDLLSEKEKLLCRRLSIFSGGWILEAAEKVCSDEILEEGDVLEVLTNLTDKSLVKVYESDNGMRYTMLETIRKYGDEKLLESDQKHLLQEKHFNYFYGLAENSESILTGAGQKEQINIISSESENIRDSLRWSLKNNKEASLRMSVALGKFWEMQSNFGEGIEFLKKGLENSQEVELIVKAKAIYWTGFFLIHQGKYIESKKYLNQCLDIFRELKDKDGEAVTLNSLGTIAVFEGEYENLKLFSEESLSISREINNKSYIARNLQNIAVGLLHQGMHDEARKQFLESLSLYRELNDAVQLAKIIGNIGALEYLLMNYDKAISAFEESLQIRRELGDRQGVAITLSNLGSVAFMQKDYDYSERLLEESLEIIREIGDRRVYVTPINTLGNIASDKGEFQKAMKLFRESIMISYDMGDKYSIAKGIEGVAMVLIGMSKFKEGCILAANYFTQLESSNKNVVEGELVRIEDIKKVLKKNLNESDFEKYWTEGETMKTEDAIGYITNYDLNE